jgi:hypothetical protein
MNWLTATVIATLLFSIYPIFGDKAGRIHGEKMNFVIDAAFFVSMAIFLAINNRADFAKITKTSFGYTLGLCFSSFGFLLMLYAWRIAPARVPIIMVIIGFSTVLTAIIYNFIGTKLSFWEWFCVGGATFFISALCLLQKRA